MDYQACATATGTRVHLRDRSRRVGNIGTLTLCTFAVVKDIRGTVHRTQMCDRCLEKFPIDWFSPADIGCKEVLIPGEKSHACD
jgi:hypothetical protein